MEKMFRSIEQFLQQQTQNRDSSPTYDNYISISMAHQGIPLLVEELLVKITNESLRAHKSRFAELCALRYKLTGKFNDVIAGEMALETGTDLETIFSRTNTTFHQTTGYHSRLPWDLLSRDGDYMNGLIYPLNKRA